MLPKHLVFSSFRVCVTRMAGRRLVFPALTVHPLPAALAGAKREAGVVLLGRSAGMVVVVVVLGRFMEVVVVTTVVEHRA